VLYPSNLCYIQCSFAEERRLQRICLLRQPGWHITKILIDYTLLINRLDLLAFKVTVTTSAISVIVLYIILNLETPE